MKKLLLTLGTTISVTLPLSVVVACGTGEDGEDERQFDERWGISRLTNEDVLGNPNRYLNVDTRMLLWDNIEDDGFNSIDLDNSNGELSPNGEEWIANTDMNLPTWLHNSHETFNNSSFNNEVHIPSEKVNWLYDLYKSDQNKVSTRFAKVTSQTSFEFISSNLNDGITFASDIRMIPQNILVDASVTKGTDVDYKIHIPASVKSIRDLAFAEMRTDVINYDFSHLINWERRFDDDNDENGIEFESSNSFYTDDNAFLQGKTITLPQLNDHEWYTSGADIRFPEMFSWKGASNAPVLIQYRSESTWDYTKKYQVVNAPTETNWSNIY